MGLESIRGIVRKVRWGLLPLDLAVHLKAAGLPQFNSGFQVIKQENKGIAYFLFKSLQPNPKEH